CLHISDPSPTQTYTLSLHDALPISDGETVEVWSWYPGRRADSGMTCIENGFAQPVQAQVRTTSAEPVVSANSKTTECRPDVKESAPVVDVWSGAAVPSLIRGRLSTVRLTRPSDRAARR